MARKEGMIRPLMIGLAVLALGGCFKSPTDPFSTGGTSGQQTGSLPVNTSDHQTVSISAAASQANAHGVYLSVTNQNGNPVTASYFRGANFHVTYNGTSIPGGSITVGTASGSGQSISTSLVLDYSGSMSGDIANLETAATAFVNNMQSNDRGEIIKFGDVPVVEQVFTADKNALRTAITRTTSAGGVTAFWDATYQGLQDTQPEGGQKAVIAFTDGYENNSIHITSQAQLIQEARTRGIPIFTIGLGSADQTGLQAIASQTNGRYYLAPDSSQLALIYQQVAQIFNNTVILSWPSFTYTSGATVVITITYVCANGTFTATASITLP